MDLTELILKPFDLAARFVNDWVRAEPFEYESMTTLPARPPAGAEDFMSMPQPLGPVIYRNRFRPDTPAEQQAQIIVVVSEEIVRDASEPERVRLLVAAAAADGFDELRRNLRRREAGSPGIEPGPSG